MKRNSTIGGDDRLMSHFSIGRKQAHVVEQGVVVGGNGRSGNTGRGIGDIEDA
jgi:uncharacterized protein (DUF849 family)